MKIKLDMKNQSAVAAALKAVNGRAESFAVTSIVEILAAAKRAESRLSMLPKSQWQGIRVYFIPAGPSSRCYKYNAASTRVVIERESSAWFIAGISSTAVSPCDKEVLSIEINSDQAAEIQRRALADFYVPQPVTAAA